MLNVSRRHLAALAAAFVLSASAVPAQAPQKPVIKVSSLRLPVLTP